MVQDPANSRRLIPKGFPSLRRPSSLAILHSPVARPAYREEMAANDSKPDPTAGLVDDPDFPPTAHLERLYSEVKGRLETQRAEFDDLQRLVAIVLAAAGVLLGIRRVAVPLCIETIPSSGCSSLPWLCSPLASWLVAWPCGRGASRRLPSRAALSTRLGVSVATNVMIFDLIQAGREAYEQNAEGGATTWRSRFAGSSRLASGPGAALSRRGFSLPTCSLDGDDREAHVRAEGTHEACDSAGLPSAAPSGRSTKVSSAKSRKGPEAAC